MAIAADPLGVWQLSRYEPLDVYGEDRLRKDLNTPMHEIRPRLYLGGYTALKIDILQKHGITHIVNCIVPAASVQDDIGIKTLCLNIEDHDDQFLDFKLVLTFIHTALSETAENIVLVHCAMGVSRSASFITAYLLQEEKKSLEETLINIQMKRCQVFADTAYYTHY